MSVTITALRNSSDPGGPIFVPISFTPDNTSTITAYTQVNITIEMPATSATSAITITYYEAQAAPVPEIDKISEVDEDDGKPHPISVWADMVMQVLPIPTPSLFWTSGVATFPVSVDAALKCTQFEADAGGGCRAEW